METPDTRLVALHAENGSPHARLSSALAALEGADWGLLLHGEAGLAKQLSALLGAGTLRIDPRFKLSREVFAAYGLALATIDADWRGSRAVWLLEPTERDFKRAARSNVTIIIDSTLAPGSGWLNQSNQGNQAQQQPTANQLAQYLVYRDGATLSGFGDLEISAIFGTGKAPVRAAPAPSDLSLAMVLRDLATLPLRLARAARTTTQLLEQFGGAAQPVGPTALLLAPDSAADTLAPLGGVLAAALAVPAGTLLSAGVQSAATALGLLRQDIAEQARSHESRQDNAERSEWSRPERPNDQRNNRAQNVPQRPETQRSEIQRPETPRLEAQRQPQPQPQQDFRPARPLQDNRNGNRPPQERPTATQQLSDKSASTERPQPHQQANRPPARTDLNYTPEIVFSQSLSQHAVTAGSAELTQITPVSSGPDEPELLPTPQEGPNQAVTNLEAATDKAQDPIPALVPEAKIPEAKAAGSEATQPESATLEPEVSLPPDLPPTPNEGGNSDVISGLDEQQQANFARLRDWRNAEAKRLEISRFIVASNATLAEIARYAPKTEEELRQVRGMGPERVRKYGAAILNTLKN